MNSHGDRGARRQAHQQLGRLARRRPFQGLRKGAWILVGKTRQQLTAHSASSGATRNTGSSANRCAGTDTSPEAEDNTTPVR